MFTAYLAGAWQGTARPSHVLHCEQVLLDLKDNPKAGPALKETPVSSVFSLSLKSELN